mmetsp:Transcript_2932/g.425  ORF Transcript_2932/g.425 Transcript_2932/m.425 type:complete len:90 (-) Transcript_2932:86-355(-)
MEINKYLYPPNNDNINNNNINHNNNKGYPNNNNTKPYSNNNKIEDLVMPLLNILPVLNKDLVVLGVFKIMELGPSNFEKKIFICYFKII